jgi:hypothetical protein
MLAVILLLPLVFVYTGLQTEIDLSMILILWKVTAAIIAVL